MTESGVGHLLDRLQSYGRFAGLVRRVGLPHEAHREALAGPDKFHQIGVCV